MWLQCVHNPPPSCMPALPIDRLGESSGIPRAILASNLDRILGRGIYLNDKVVSVTLESLATVATPAAEPRLTQKMTAGDFLTCEHTTTSLPKPGLAAL